MNLYHINKSLSKWMFVYFGCLMKVHVDLNFVVTKWSVNYLKDHLGKNALREQISCCTGGRAEKYLLQSCKA